MAMIIVLLLNGVCVVFLLYVLVNLGKEALRSGNGARRYAVAIERQAKSEVLVVTRPISSAARSGFTVIPFQARDRAPAGQPGRRTAARGTIEMPARQISTR
jgi:hypothetical protein